MIFTSWLLPELSQISTLAGDRLHPFHHRFTNKVDMMDIVVMPGHRFMVLNEPFGYPSESSITRLDCFAKQSKQRQKVRLDPYVIQQSTADRFSDEDSDFNAEARASDASDQASKHTCKNN